MPAPSGHHDLPLPFEPLCRDPAFARICRCSRSAACRPRLGRGRSVLRTACVALPSGPTLDPRRSIGGIWINRSRPGDSEMRRRSSGTDPNRRQKPRHRACGITTVFLWHRAGITFASMSARIGDVRGNASLCGAMRNHARLFSDIGETGFEPATARPPAECATRLRHSPWLNYILTDSSAAVAQR